MTFDTWEVMIQPPEDYLMHFRTKGSKNGVRRYQQPDGTWTPLGLAERKKREGWGETRKERRAAKQLARAERHQARKEARMQSRAARAEKKRLKSLKGLTDDELQKKINRLKMEQEYKELKKSPLIKTGADLVGKYLQYKNTKTEREIERNKQVIELERIKSGSLKAKELTKQKKFEANKAKEDRKKMEADVHGGLKKERKAKLIEQKNIRSDKTITGGIRKKFNKILSATGDRKAAQIKAHISGDEARINSDAARTLSKRQQRQHERDLAPERRRTERLAKERQRTRKEFERRMERIERPSKQRLAAENERARRLAEERRKTREEYARRMNRIRSF